MMKGWRVGGDALVSNVPELDVLQCSRRDCQLDNLNGYMSSYLLHVARELS